MKRLFIRPVLVIFLLMLIFLAYADMGDKINYQLYTMGLKKDIFEYIPPNPLSPSVFERQGIWKVSYGPNYTGIFIYGTLGYVVVFIMDNLSTKFPSHD